MVKKYSFPEKYQQKIASALSSIGYSIDDPRRLALSVIKLSDHYQKQEKTTPWNQPEFMAAYLAYFFPLNYMRNLKVFDEVQRLKLPLHFQSFVDFGFGLGSAFLAARDLNVVNDSHSLYAIDSSSKPLDFFNQHIDSTRLQRNYSHKGGQKTCGVFSYSLNELTQAPEWFTHLDTIIILEPSTSQWGRKLMDWRSHLIDQGYSIWAPCTHHEACPLLTHSKKDWCHDRIHWIQPEWFQKLEGFLPMKNNTMTFSYLIASRTPALRTADEGRIVGDELKEKGKSRWLYCRGDQREYLSWLNKQGDPPDWHRGELLKPAIEEIKGNELRIKLY